MGLSAGQSAAADKPCRGAAGAVPAAAGAPVSTISIAAAPVSARRGSEDMANPRVESELTHPEVRLAAAR